MGRQALKNLAADFFSIYQLAYPYGARRGRYAHASVSAAQSPASSLQMLVKGGLGLPVS